MYSLLIYNAKILTCNKQDKFYEDGAIIIHGGKIIDVLEKGKTLPPASCKIDNKGRLLTPGLIDCHTHVIYGGEGRADEFEKRMQGSSYESIAEKGGGILATVRATRQEGVNSLFLSAQRRLKQMMRYGTMTCEIKSGYGLDLKNELKMLRVAQLLENYLPINIVPTFLAAHTLPPEYADKDSYIDDIIKYMLPEVFNSRFSQTIDAFCEKIAFSNTQIERLFLAAKSYNFRIRLHAEQLSNQGGAVLAAKFKALSVDHLEYLSLKDIPLIRENKTVAVLLPGAFYFLREKQKPPVKNLLDEGVDIAVATDSNPGTSPFLSLPLMMNMACVFFGLTPYQAFKGVTVNAAKALGLENNIGSIEIGKSADVILWKCQHYNPIIYNTTSNYLSSYIKSGFIVNLNKIENIKGELSK